MDYDIVGGDTQSEIITFYRIFDLIELAENYKNHNFRFLETDYSPKEIISWRGSYSIPAIDYCDEKITGSKLAKVLKEGLKKTHYGYKGGDYKYTDDEEFYVARYGRSDEYKIVGYENKDNEVILLTKIDVY